MTALTLTCDAVSLVRPRAGGGERRVLDELDARFEPGSIAVVEGPNGCGKSSLIHVLAAIVRPTSGTVRVGDDPVSRWTAGHRDGFRRKVGLVPQVPLFIDGLTALENVMAPLVARERSLARIAEASSRALQSLALDSLIESPARELSAGERQRVSVARALVSQASFLLADEPTSSQDDEGKTLVVDALEKEAKAGRVVVVTTHDARLEGWGDRLEKMNAGKFET